MPPKFIPRTLPQCEQALGDVTTPDLCAAFHHGLAQEDTEPGLFRLLSKPRRGDWLDTHQELGQSFPQYAKRMNPQSGRALPRPACDGLLICPIGKSFDSDIGRLFMPHLVKYCAAFFPGMSIEVLDKPLSLKDVGKRDNDFGHSQYLIGDIFTMLNTHKEVVSKRRAYCRLGVTLEDIFPGEEWNYVFGQARPIERVGVFSFARHSPVFYNGVHAIEAIQSMTPSSMLGWLRTCRHTMVHETCHMLGILHCIFWHCLMNGNNGPHDSNGSTPFLCPVCLRKLMYALAGVCGPEAVAAIDERYANLEVVLGEVVSAFGNEACEDVRLRKDLDWLAFRRSQLQEALSTEAPPIPTETTRRAKTELKRGGAVARR